MGWASCNRTLRRRTSRTPGTYRCGLPLPIKFSCRVGACSGHGSEKFNGQLKLEPPTVAMVHETLATFAAHPTIERWQYQLGCCGRVHSIPPAGHLIPSIRALARNSMDAAAADVCERRDKQCVLETARCRLVAVATEAKRAAAMWRFIVATPCPSPLSGTGPWLR
jgi:hypothetical protein